MSEKTGFDTDTVSRKLVKGDDYVIVDQGTKAEQVFLEKGYVDIAQLEQQEMTDVHDGNVGEQSEHIEHNLIQEVDTYGLKEQVDSVTEDTVNQSQVATDKQEVSNENIESGSESNSSGDAEDEGQ